MDDGYDTNDESQGQCRKKKTLNRTLWGQG